MFTPYDWQEGIGNRAAYIEGKLAQGSPVLALSLDEGILYFTYRRQAQKIYEIYDRLIFAAVGQQSDVEALRMAALEFTSREGYNRSDEDVTIQRVVTALSASIKKAFGDFGSAPLVARSLFAEVNETPEKDIFYLVDYDGDYSISRGYGVIAGEAEMTDRLRGKLAGIKSDTKPDQAIDQLREIWLSGMNPEGQQPDEDLLDALSPEAILLERSDARENRFRVLVRSEV